eukprot:CAMPEP_0185201282 /NCGR_PEP_ID=MMETSP1140-20130426/48954_1 /TAXON_ID=298111 /ORGANISM="Pavlova sp., Strain CCMP459" /LENGTH=66 /DNA_ID=CAMNT_0027768669 /DNA_START=45 /DNA_END=242 /DNA_ORIENTATION=-
MNAPKALLTDVARSVSGSKSISHSPGMPGGSATPAFSRSSRTCSIVLRCAGAFRRANLTGVGVVAR